MKVGSVNVVAMSDMEMAIVDLVDRRGVDIVFVQETRWKGEAVRWFRALIVMDANSYTMMLMIGKTGLGL